MTGQQSAVGINHAYASVLEGIAMLEFLFVLLGIVVGYNIRHERQLRRENLVLEKVDARLRRELEIAQNLNQSLLADLAALKQSLAKAQRVTRSMEACMAPQPQTTVADRHEHPLLRTTHVQPLTGLANDA
jgi:hypothetical protein